MIDACRLWDDDGDAYLLSAFAGSRAGIKTVLIVSKISEAIELKNGRFYLRGKVEAGAMCQFSFSADGRNFQNISGTFKALEGKWIGARVGLFFNRPAKFNDAGTVDIDWFRFELNN